MALSQPDLEAELLPPGRPLVLRLDPLHNWTDLLVLGFGIIFAGYLATGDVFARGFSKDPAILNNFWRFAPIAVALLLVGCRRFRRVTLVVDDDRLVAAGTLGSRKECRIEDLAEITQEGRTIARQLVFRNKDQVVFKMLRRSWTRMQLTTLSVFLDRPVPGVNDPVRRRMGLWAASVFTLGLDLVFVVVGGAVLWNAVAADLEAHDYQQAINVCYNAAAPPVGCYQYVELQVVAFGDPMGNQYPVLLGTRTRSYATGVASTDTQRLLPRGFITYGEVWRGQLTHLESVDKTWLRTTDNPFYREQAGRSGGGLLFVGLVAFFPILFRLHPILI
jgi:hypothetical protein